MAKKQRFEQIEGLPEALENKADKADVIPYVGANQPIDLNTQRLRTDGIISNLSGTKAINLITKVVAQNQSSSSVVLEIIGSGFGRMMGTYNFEIFRYVGRSYKFSLSTYFFNGSWYTPSSVNWESGESSNISEINLVRDGSGRFFVEVVFTANYAFMTVSVDWVGNLTALGHTFNLYRTSQIDLTGYEIVRTITPSQFNRDSYNLDYNNFTNTPTIPTVNDGELSLSTGTGLSGSATFTANQEGDSTFSVSLSPATLSSLSLADSALQSGDDISELNNDSGYLQDNDLNGLLENPTYDSDTHIFTMDVVGGGTFSIDFPIEALITNVDLDDDNNLVITFEDGSEVLVPLNTLLVGVVKSVNGKTPNSQGEVVINITDIAGLDTELNKIGNLASLTTTNKNNLVDAINEVNGNTNSIEIGGRNLIREVDTMSLGSNASKGIDDFGQYIRFQTLNSGSPQFTHVKYQDNTQYTLSVEASVETGAYFFWYFVYTDGSNSGITSTIINNSATPVIRRATSAINKTIDYIAYTWQSGGYRRIYNIKLEKGNKATDWTPAPEDQVSDWNETDSNAYSFIKNKPDLSVYLEQSDLDGLASESWVNSNYATTNEINNIYDQLSAKANDRLSNVASNLSQSEKGALLGKIGAVSEAWVALQGFLTSVSWNEISDKPALFPPTAHIHSANEISSGVFSVARIPTGTTAGTVALGDDSRINNGQTAFGWGNHALAGYLTSTDLNDYATEAWVDSKLETIELTPGQDGKTLLSGTSNPANSLGTVGDWYLNRTTWTMFEKTGATTWTNRGVIKGADGSTWYNGVSNPTTEGVVGDWYIKTSTWDVYRKISSNSWNHYGNIKGEDGVPADISNKANTDGSNTIGGMWSIEGLETGFLGTYLYTGYFDNDSIHIPFSDALVDWKGVELGAENIPVMIAEDKTNNYIYRTGLPSNGYPVWARTGNYVIESKHRFRVHKHENLDALDNGVGKVILTPYNAIEHQYFDVNIFGEMEVLELDIQSPERDELTGHLIRRNDYGQRISVCVRTNAKVMFTNIQGVSFPNGGQNGIYKYVWDGVWLFDGYSPNEF